MSDEEDFLARWSRRKRRVAEEEIPPEADMADAPDPDPVPATEEEEAALLEKLGLPKPETLGPGDDFKAFMAQGVPQVLRRRALRVLWRTNPVLANLDGLNDYDADFNSPDLTKKILATGYQVGRGFVSRAAETAGKVELEDVPEVATAEHADVKREMPASAEEPLPEHADDAPPEPAPRPRRMRFET
jgi:hypothetical protein